MTRTQFFAHDKAWPSEKLFVRAVSLREVMPPKYVDRPSGTAEHLVMCFHDQVRLWHNGEVIDAPAGTVILWTPGKKHWFGRPSGEWSHTWMYVTGPCVGESIASAGFPADTLLGTGAEPVMNTYMPMIYHELLNHAPADAAVLEGLFGIMLRELARCAHGDRYPQRMPEPFRGVREFIEANLSRRLTLGDLADAAYLSPSQFIAGFRRWYGTTPMQYVIDQRMRRAALALSDLSLKIAEIAYSLGYDDPLYFSKQFTRAFGRSPRAYRRELMREA